jgi:uncharacterized membrane protein
MAGRKWKSRDLDTIFIIQLMMVAFFWILVTGLTIWLLNLLRLAIELNDVPGFSVVISLVAIPVFWTLASVLTYVFVGLRRNRNPD